MERAKLLEILTDWNFWSRDHETGIPRQEYLQQLSALAGTGQVIVLLGVRRSGKSTLMRQYIQQLRQQKVDSRNILYVNFEDVRFQELDLEILQQIYEVYLEQLQPSAKPHIFLDEVHKVPHWEKFVRTLHELGKAQLYVSGSNSHLLFGTIASVLTGRHLDLQVFPLRFEEFLHFQHFQYSSQLDLISKRHQVKPLLDQYLHFGGFPLVCLKDNKRELLETYFEDILNKDIIERHQPKHILKLKSLAKFYVANSGRRVSFHSISKFLDISLDTVERYSYYLEEAYLLYFTKKFSYSLKVQEKTMSIVYVVDNGLRNLLSSPSEKGWLYQNAVAHSLIKKYGKDKVFYWMGTASEEVDFIIKGAKVEQLIQVCYNLENIETKEREVKALLKAAEELRCSNLLIITENTEGQERIGKEKVSYTPLWKWLFGK